MNSLCRLPPDVQRHLAVLLVALGRGERGAAGVTAGFQAPFELAAKPSVSPPPAIVVFIRNI